MSRPRAWNGSAWAIDPQFNVGPSYSPDWRQWKAHIEETPGQHPFTSNNEGWESSDGAGGIGAPYVPAAWAGGAISVTTNNPGIISECNLRRPSAGGVSGWIPGQRVANRYTFSTQQVGTTNPPIIIRIGRPFSGADNLNLPTSTNGVQTVTSTSDHTTGTGFFNLNMRLGLNDAWLAQGNRTRLTLLEAVAIDLNTGAPIRRVSQQGWEPKVWNGSSWI